MENKNYKISEQDRARLITEFNQKLDAYKELVLNNNVEARENSERIDNGKYVIAERDSKEIYMLTELLSLQSKILNSEIIPEVKEEDAIKIGDVVSLSIVHSSEKNDFENLTVQLVSEYDESKACNGIEQVTVNSEVGYGILGNKPGNYISFKVGNKIKFAVINEVLNLDNESKLSR